MLNAEVNAESGSVTIHSFTSALSIRSSALPMCSTCDDTGWKPVEVDGVRRVVRCECWQGEHTRRLFDGARIPPRYRRCDFDNFQVYPNEKLVNAVAAVRRFAENFPAGAKGLCLIGPHGIGKTHLAVAALRSVAWARVRRALLRGHRSPAAYSQHLQPGDQNGRDADSPAARLGPVAGP